MSLYSDTSFLFRLYELGPDAETAVRFASGSKESLIMCRLQHFEFTQAVRLRMFRFNSDQIEGLSRHAGAKILNAFATDLNRNFFKFIYADYDKILKLSEDISARYTREYGYRSFDVFHVATAINLGATNFLTFDRKQSQLAKAEGLQTPMQ